MRTDEKPKLIILFLVTFYMLTNYFVNFSVDYIGVDRNTII